MSRGLQRMPSIKPCTCSSHNLHVLSLIFLFPLSSHFRPHTIQDDARGKLLIAANHNHNALPTKSPSETYHAALHPKRVMSFDRLAAQQTPEGTYSLILSFSSSGPVIRFKCGYNGCNATVPIDKIPSTCKNKSDPHVHRKYDMVPVAFTTIPANCAHDFGPTSPEGLPIPATFSITTQVLYRFILFVTTDFSYFYFYTC